MNYWVVDRIALYSLSHLYKIILLRPVIEVDYMVGLDAADFMQRQLTILSLSLMVLSLGAQHQDYVFETS